MPFDDEVVQSGLKAFQAARKRAEAEYHDAEAYNNTDAAFAASLEMAEIDRKANDLVNLYENTRPKPEQQAPEESPEQLRVKPLTQWRDAAKILGITEAEYEKNYYEMLRSGWRPGSQQNGIRG